MPSQPGIPPGARSQSSTTQWQQSFALLLTGHALEDRADTPKIMAIPQGIGDATLQYSVKDGQLHLYNVYNHKTRTAPPSSERRMMCHRLTSTRAQQRSPECCTNEKRRPAPDAQHRVLELQDPPRHCECRGRIRPPQIRRTAPTMSKAALAKVRADPGICLQPRRRTRGRAGSQTRLLRWSRTLQDDQRMRHSKKQRAAQQWAAIQELNADPCSGARLQTFTWHHKSHYNSSNANNPPHPDRRPKTGSNKAASQPAQDISIQLPVM